LCAAPRMFIDPAFQCLDPQGTLPRLLDLLDRDRL
jgi:hypothetical protein